MAASLAHRRILTGLAAIALVLGGCAFGGANAPVEIPEPPGQPQNAAPSQPLPRLRPPINTTRNLYEGSLWRGAASWGNLLRDHRARYPGDLLTVTEMQKIIKVPELKPEEEAPNQGAQQAGQGQGEGEQPQEAIDPILAFLRAQEKRREEIEEEQNEILRSIDTMEVQVVRVLPNGNMLVRGVHPPIFRDNNRVKYIVTLEGIVRPTDVDEANNVLATRLSKAEYKIRRLVRRDTVPAGDALRAAGRPKEGALFDRLTNFLTGPGTGNRSRRVETRQ